MSLLVLMKKNRIATLLTSGATLFVGVKAFIVGVQVANGDIQWNAALSFATTNILFICLLFVSWVTTLQVRRLNNEQAWLIDAVNWNIERLKSKQNVEANSGYQLDKIAMVDPRWP